MKGFINRVSVIFFAATFFQGCSPMDSIDKKSIDSKQSADTSEPDIDLPLNIEDQSTNVNATLVNTTLGRSGRYMTKNGKATFFLGVDTQELAANPNYNYISVLNNLVASKINKVRVWVYCSWNRTGFIHPWLLSSGKYNLDKWNEAYWDRLAAIVKEANSRGIVVEVSIFSEYPANRSNRWVTSSPWNRANNVNGAFSSNSSGNFFPDFMNLNLTQKSTSGKTLKMYQQALIDKTLSELGSYPNVYFEIMNEFPGVLALCGTTRCIDKVHPWQTYWVNYIAGKSSRLVTAHSHEFKLDTHGVEFFWNNANVDVLGFHLYSTSPVSTSNALNKMQLKGKIIQENESHGFEITGGVAIVTKQMWAMFMSGGHYGIYVDNSSLFSSTAWQLISIHAKILRTFSERFNIAKMSPVDASGKEYDNQVITSGLLLSQWQVLAYPGVQYAAYFYGGSAGSVKANLPSGKQYRYTWYDVRNGNTLRTGLVSGGSGVTLNGPGSFDVALGAALIIEAAATGEIILDNINSGQTGSGILATGTWCASAASGFYGMNSLFSCSKSTTDRYRFSPSIPTTRNYNVYIRYTSNANRTTSARFAVKHASGTTTKNYNQQSGGNAWILHGTYKLNAGTGNYVEAYESSAAAEVSADAVRFLPAP